MRKTFILFTIFISAWSCASKFRVIKKGPSSFTLTSKAPIFIENLNCDNRSCFESTSEIQRELNKLLKNYFLDKGFLVAKKREDSKYTIKIISTYKTKYMGQLPRNVHFSIWEKTNKINSEIFQFGIAKQYNGRFLKKDEELNETFNVFLSNFNFQKNDPPSNLVSNRKLSANRSDHTTQGKVSKRQFRSSSSK